MNETEETVKKSISERLDEIFASLSKDQIRFLIALQDYPSKKEAAEAIDLKPNTVYNWNGMIDEAAKLMAQERLEAAKALRRKALIKAIAVKIAGLDSKNENMRQNIATQIIEWEMGQATQRFEHSGEIKGDNSDAHNRALLSLADALGKVLPGEGAEQ